jgi:hypothetical protein
MLGFEIDRLPPSTYSKTLERVGIEGRGINSPLSINFTKEARNFIYSLSREVIKRHPFQYVDTFFAFDIKVKLICSTRAQFNREFVVECFNQVIENSIGVKANQIFSISFDKKIGSRDATIIEITILNRKGEEYGTKNDIVKKRRERTVF